MIYLLRSPSFNKHKGRFEWILKIGWTEDSNSEKRLRVYRSHNPSVEKISIIPGYSIETEIGLHDKFSKYRLDEFGKEWYKDESSIINFFTTKGKIQELKKLTEKGKEIIKQRKSKQNRQLYKYIITLLEIKPEKKLEGDDEKEWLNSVSSFNKIFIEDKLEKFTTLPKEIKEIVFKLSNYSNPKNRLKYLESIWSGLEEEEQELLINNWIEKEVVLKL